MTVFSLLYVTALLIPLIVIGPQARSNGDSEPMFTVSDLGLVNGVGSCADAINDAGDVIGTMGVGKKAALSPAANHFFLWSKGRAVELPASFAVVGINDKGQLIANEYPKDFDPFDPSMFLKFRPTIYGDGEWKGVLPKDAVSGVAVALNDEGRIAGQLQGGSAQNVGKSLTPAIWSSKGYELLSIPAPYTSGVVKGMNNRGQCVGILQTISGQPLPTIRNQAALWDKNGVTLLGAEDGFGQSEAVAINTGGSILCKEYVVPSLQQTLGGGLSQAGFVWKDGKCSALFTPGDIALGIDATKGFIPRALNNNGAVVGKATGLNGGPVAFLWQRHRLVDLNNLIASDTGWTLTDAKGINERGQIVGQGKYGGELHAFLLTPLPNSEHS